jgi:hypothetical protein
MSGICLMTNNEKELPGKFHVYPEQAAAGLCTIPTEMAIYYCITISITEKNTEKVRNQSMAKVVILQEKNSSNKTGHLR